MSEHQAGPPRSGAARWDRAALLALQPGERRAALRTALGAELGRLLGLGARPPEPGKALAALGLDSLAAVELMALVEERTGALLDLSELLTGCTTDDVVGQILRQLAAAAPDATATGATAGAPAAYDAPAAATTAARHAFALSAGQRGLWLLHRMAPASAAYHLAGAGRLLSRVEPATLRWALQALVDRHAALRTTFEDGVDGPLQEVHERREVALLVQDAAGWDAAELQRRLEMEAFRPFDLERGPLLRAVLFTGGGGAGDVLLVALHHIVADFWSLAVLVRELAALVAARTAGEPPGLPPPGIGIADLVGREERLLAGPESERHWEFWRAELRGAAPLDLPTDRPRPAVQDDRGGARALRLPAAAAGALWRLARDCGCTPFMVVLAAFQAVLGRLSGQEDLIVGTPTSGRDAAEKAGLVGYLVNTIALRADLSGSPTSRELLARTRRAELAAFAHRDLPFTLLVERLQPQRDAARAPLVQALAMLYRAPARELAPLAAFALGEGGARLALPGLVLESMRLESHAAQLDLALMAAEMDGEVAVSLRFAAALFDAATAERLLRYWANLAAAMTADPGRPVADLGLLQEAERHQLLVEWSGGDAAPRAAAGRSLHELVTAQAARTPRGVAVVCGEERVTYAELERASARLARRLRRLGVGAESRVGIFIARRPAMVVAMLAVLRAGGAYVALDPLYPRRRLELLLAASGARLVLTESTLSAALPAFDGLALLLDRESGTAAAPAAELAEEPAAAAELAEEPAAAAELAAESAAAAESAEESAAELPRECDPEQLAYVLFTSGSTGTPKGVAVRHGGAVMRVLWAAAAYAPARRAGVLAATSICFDLSVFEIFVPLATGGSVILADDALALPGLAAKGSVTLLNTVPSALAELLLAGVPPSVRTVNAAGEPLRRELVRRLYELPGVEEVYNLYGPTEDTVYSLGALAERLETGEPAIGRPLPGSRAYLLDARLQPVPAGAAGELWLGGGGLARGYLGRPELTAERFCPDPFAAQPGSRLYRTGDLARRRQDGSVLFLGRLDQQVKVRGFRVELGEIEAALLAHPAVREAAATAQADETGGRLAAYVVAAPGVGLALHELRGSLQGRLPEYMVPSAWLALPELPRTANGKVDRRALPAPPAPSAPAGEWELAGGATSRMSRTSWTARTRRTPAEELVAAAFAEVLGREGVGSGESFFDLGGHSLLAARVAARLREPFGVELPLRALFESPTVAALASRLEALRAGDGADAGAPPPPPLRPGGRDRSPQLSFAQERLWLLHHLEPAGAAYNMPAALRLEGPLEVAALAGALGEVVRRHEVLRTRVESIDGVAAGAVEAAPWQAWVRVDLAALEPARRQAEAAALARREAGRPFDLARPPWPRLVLLALGGEAWVMLLTLHHIAADGWSLGVLAGELGALYAALREGRPSPLPELAIQYRDYAAWQRQWLAGEVLAGQLSYWRQRLAGAPALIELPADRRRPAVQGSRGASVELAMGEAAWRALRTFCRGHGATPFMALLAVFAALLARLTGELDLVVGTPVAGRRAVETEGLIGLFVNSLALRCGLAGDPDLAALLRRVREEVLAAHAHQDLPFEKLVEDLAPRRSLDHAPLFQVMLVVEQAAWRSLDLPGLRVEAQAPVVAAAKLDLTVSWREEAAGLRGTLEYSRDLFDAATVRRLAGHLEVLTEELLADPQRALSAVALLSAAERQQLRREWNDRRRSWSGLPDGPPVVHALIEAQAAATPRAAAVSGGGETLSYGSLEARANQLARRLRRLGVGRGSRVGLLVGRTPEMVVALLAILKTGGAYVPLDPSHPAARLRLVLDDAAVSVLLSHEAEWAEVGGGLAAAAEGWRTVLLDSAAERAAAAGESAARLAVAVAGEDVAYVIYTSGSTGRPKGVQVPHRAVVNFLCAMARRPGVGAGDVVPALTTLSFDPAGLEIFVPLMQGGRVEVVSRDEARDGVRLAARLAACSATVVQATPATWRLLLESGWRGSPGLKVVCGGEALSWELAEQLLAGGCELWNGYGPTETTVYAAVRLAGGGVGAAESAAGRRGGVPIGGPIDNTSLYVVDAALELVPMGVAGELLIGGRGLARGYLGQAGLTAERFVPDGFGDEAGGRLYRTGDLVRWLAAGEVDFLGRRDHQVKVRGVRIELGEVEAVLAAHPAVAAAAVVGHAAPEGVSLAAYVVAAHPASAVAAGGLAVAELRAHLRRHLPEAMVPAVFVELPALPLTVTGKVDRRALRFPVQASGEEALVAPRTPVEAVVARVFAEVLGRERVGMEESFFDLGGHSLLAMRLIARLRGPLGVELPLSALFESPTPAALAGRLEAAEGGEALKRAEAMRKRAGTTAERAETMAEHAGTVAQRAGVSAEHAWAIAGGELPFAAAEGSAAEGGDGGGLPLSFAQERLWFLDRLEPGSAAYNMPAVVRLSGALEVAALVAALAEVVRRHEVLRARFANRDGSAVQEVGAERWQSWAAVDLRALPPGRREGAAAALARREAARPFDLARGALLRVGLVRLDAAEWMVLLTMHHIASDGWSVGVLIGEVAALYPALRAGLPSPLPELPVRYVDFARWQRQRLRGAALAGELDHWRGRLAGVPEELALPVDRRRPAAPSGRGGDVAVALDAAAWRSVRGLGRRLGATPFMVLLAAFEMLLARLTGQLDVVVGTPVAGRRWVESEGLIGLFVNTLVLRVGLDGDPGFAAVVGRVREAVLAAHAHQELPFEKLVEELAPERSLGRTPLFQVMFGLDDELPREIEVANLRLRLQTAAVVAAKFDLTLAWRYAGEALEGSLEYSRDLFDGATARRLSGQLAVLTAVLLAAPERALSAQPLLSAPERQQLTAEWSMSEGRPEAWAGECLPALIAARAARTPRAVAVMGSGWEMSYGELAARAGRLARRLRRLGVGPEVPVGVCVGRSPQLVVSLLGVLEAGGVYVPLDPSYPAERLAWMLEDCGAPLVVSGARESAALPQPGPRRVLVEAGEGEQDEGAEVAGGAAAGEAAAGEAAAGEAAAAGGSAARAAEESGGEAAAGPGNLAWVLYTSGSSGGPKGVGVAHAAAAAHMLAAAALFALAPGDRVLQLGSLSFDASLEEILPALLAGATCVLRDEELWEPARFLQRSADLGLTVLDIPTAYWQRWVAEMPPSAPPGLRLRLVAVGGEAMSGESARQWFGTPVGAVRLLNTYGPTEAVVTATWLAVDRPGDEDGGGGIGIGRPLGERSVHVLDGAGEPVPVGVLGELHLGGPLLARGYLGRPRLTAERFVPDRFGEAAGGRLYRTGDLVRWRPGGGLEFAGRLDGQVKVRGFRVEPGEIEAVLREHPAVAQAAVVARPDPAGGVALRAGVVARQGSEPPRAGALRDYLRGRLPGPLVPAELLLLPALPLTPAGKVDRRALALLPVDAADPADGAAAAGGEPAALRTLPRTPVEELVVGIFAEVLGRARVGIGESFFDLGGHSLLATQLVARLRGPFGVELPLAALFESPTPAAVAARLEGLIREGGAPARPPLVREMRGAGPPLSFSQQRLWLIDQLTPGSAAYNIPGALRVAGPLAPAAMGAAVAAVARRHEALRTRVAAGGREPVQLIEAAAESGLAVVDLAGLSAARREALATALARQEAARPFDLERGPLLRRAFLRLGPQDWVVLLTMHHIVSDGWSVGILIDELAVLYPALCEGRPAPLAELPVQFADYALWQRRWFQGEERERLLRYWREQLAGGPRAGLALAEIPSDRPRPKVARHAGASCHAQLDPRAAQQLRQMARRQGVTLFMALAGACDVVLQRYSGEDDLAIGSAVAGRTQAETEKLIGFFVNTVVLRCNLGGDPGMAALLRRVAATCLGAYAHQEVPFEALVAALGPGRDPERTPFFQVFLNLLNLPRHDIQFAGLHCHPLPLAVESAKFDLTWGVSEDEAGLGLDLVYDPDLFDRATALRLNGHLAALLVWLAGAAADQDRLAARLSQVPLLAAGERHQLVVEWNDTDPADPTDPHAANAGNGASAANAANIADAANGANGASAANVAANAADSGTAADSGSAGTPGIAGSGGAPIAPPGCLHDLFSRQAARSPDAVAVELRGGSALTYGELDRRSDRLCRRLQLAGASRGRRIAVLAPRSPEMAVMVLAVLKAGAAFVALDPEHPPARQAAILAGSRAALVLVEDSLIGVVREGWPEAVVHGPGGGALAGLADPSAAAVPAPPAARPDDLAYVVFTSGSTGQPKGILSTHRAAVSHLRWLVRHHGLAASDVALQLAPLTGDASLRDLLAPLAVGARVILVPAEAARQPAVLAEIIAERRVTCLPSIVPSVLRRLAEAVGRLPSGADHAQRAVRLILASGESLHGADCARVREAFGAATRLVNQYGPTECTLTSTYHLATAADEASGAVLIGRPLGGVRVHVLDRQLAGVPIGGAGEICIGGAGLAWGYLGQPDRTAEVFVPDPTERTAGGRRLYRTGDRGRRLAGGELEFRGRGDRQIKLRGMRIEPGEIEAALGAHPHVQSAAVLLWSDAAPVAVAAPQPQPPAEGQVVAYVAPRAGQSLAAPALRAFLRERLPEHLVPGRFIVLALLPMLPNGKVDRAALPPPAAFDADRRRVEPRTVLEAEMLALWRELMRLDDIGVEDRFFALGGHSLLAAQLVMRVREKWHVQLRLGAIFKDPTVAVLAAEVALLLPQVARLPEETEGAAGEVPALAAAEAGEREEIEI